MARIDEKIHELEFDRTTTASADSLRRLVVEAAEQAGPERIVLGDVTAAGASGIVRNQLRIQHGAFSLTFAEHGDATLVSLRITDYLRTRETIGYVIPVGPWAAPAYSMLHRFSHRVRAALGADQGARP